MRVCPLSDVVATFRDPGTTSQLACEQAPGETKPNASLILLFHARRIFLRPYQEPVSRLLVRTSPD